MKTTCLYENEEFGNTVRDILLDKKIQAETTRATEAENRLKESVATGTVTGLKISEDKVIQLIGLNDRIIAEAPLNIEIPAGIKTISLNGTVLSLTYSDETSKSCDLSSLLDSVNEAISQEQSRASRAEEALQEAIEGANGAVADLANGAVADLEQRIEVLEQKVANLEKFHPTSDN